MEKLETQPISRQGFLCTENSLSCLGERILEGATSGGDFPTFPVHAGEWGAQGETSEQSRAAHRVQRQQLPQTWGDLPVS